jgi:hypothetical protein
VNPRDHHRVDPFTLGQLDAQLKDPTPPVYATKAAANSYLTGWRLAAPDRPVPNVLQKEWRWLRVLYGE